MPTSARPPRRALQFDLPGHHEDEENGLFPMLASRALPEDGIEDILEQLKIEHAADESFATELIDQLETMARGERPENPDMLGYMLRGFLRRLPAPSELGTDRHPAARTAAAG